MNSELFPTQKTIFSKKEKKTNEAQEKKEQIKPELTIEFNKKVLTSLSERYSDYKEMFKKFSQLPPIKFERGKVNFIFGQNGSGKSTLANAIFLAAQIEHLIQNEPAIDFLNQKKMSPEKKKKEAIQDVIHPNQMYRYTIAELVGMAAAPILVEEEALVISQFQASKSYDRKSDAPIVYRIAVQDILGERKEDEQRASYEKQLDPYKHLVKESESFYAESGASARQMVEEKLKLQFEQINPGSIIIIDESTFGLSPKRQIEYIKILEQLAKEKDLIVIAPENSGYAFDTSSTRIDLKTPEKGLFLSEARSSEKEMGIIKIESQEALPETTMEFTIDQNKIQQLIEVNPKFRSMLETFAKLPESLAFGQGKTEIFADNGGGKTTMLGIMYLLMQIESNVNDEIEENLHMKGKKGEKESLRKEQIKNLVINPFQPNDKIFIESLGFARELIISGAITLKNTPLFPQKGYPTMEGVRDIMWVNLLEVSGGIKMDTFNVIGYLTTGDSREISKTMKENRPEQIQASTRQTVEDLLFKTIQHMKRGGFLFIDEIDGGISPDRQLQISNAVNKLAKEKGITIIATTNSYEGNKFHLTPFLDLSAPETGVASPVYKLLETKN